VRRLLAWLVLTLFSFALISPALLADADSNLPACCRRSGHHRCAMDRAQDGPTGQTIRTARCPIFPGVHAASVAVKIAALARVSQPAFAATATEPQARSQTQTLLRIAYSRSTQKRGPPNVHS
jgi:hypothetical protein